MGSHGENSSTRGVYASTNSTASNAGAVFVYERSGASWASKTFVKSSNTDSKDSFGWGMAISGDGGTLAVGAYREDSSATGINPTPGTDATADENVGAVYLY
ncbi:hemagglutinin protein [endosymbiont of Tevnia jerichonana]|uniref:Hemagglutinin protein n=1 Tax=endosymbiont of Tevnia jerichonana (vent Tica) TaxID=1049564 RepID=G2FHX4_9GAMM|nr:hemagglutinin protein [endosymbiont of Tevnia jerichonana (vent Tica)]